jgi:hypothetical protein
MHGVEASEVSYALAVIGISTAKIQHTRRFMVSGRYGYINEPYRLFLCAAGRAGNAGGRDPDIGA